MQVFHRPVRRQAEVPELYRLDIPVGACLQRAGPDASLGRVSPETLAVDRSPLTLSLPLSTVDCRQGLDLADAGWFTTDDDAVD